MIDEHLGWLENIRMRSEGSRTALEMSQILDRESFYRYACPYKIIHDNSSEFNGQEFQEMLFSYGVKSQLTTVHNSRANIVERIHLSIADHYRINQFNLKKIGRIA